MADWKEIDSTLRTLACQRTALDVEEARWLRAAKAEAVHLRFGCASLVEYMEEALGYTPKVAVERLRVANALGELPAVEAAMRGGRMTFSAVREVTRVAVPETAAAWIEACEGKRVHQVERLVSGRAKGDLPGDPRRPDLELRELRHEVSPRTLALYRQACRVLEAETGEAMSDDAILAALCQTVIEGHGDLTEAEAQGRAPHQVVVVVCEQCQAGQQVAGGVAFDLPASAVDEALCDAQCVGHVHGNAPERAGQDVPPAVRRMVMLRDGLRCRVPWCRSARYLHLHHLDGRDVDDPHAPEKLVTLCGFHHREHHDGRLAIAGRRSSTVVFDRPRVGVRWAA